MTARCSHSHLPMTCRWPGGDRTISCRPTATGRRPGSHCPGACRSPSGHRPKVMSLAEEIGRSPNSHPAVAGRRLCLTFYDMVQGRENPAMIRRCLKTGIGGKSADHHTILKACDAAIRRLSKHCESLGSAQDFFCAQLDIPSTIYQPCQISLLRLGVQLHIY